MAADDLVRVEQAVSVVATPVRESTERFGGISLSDRTGAARGPTARQWISVFAGALTLLALWLLEPRAATAILHRAFLALFSIAIGMRLVCLALARRPRRVRRLRRGDLPPYTIIAPLYREAHMVEGLAAAIGALDYPMDRLQVIFALERDDRETLAAVALARLRCMVEVVIAPPGGPRTKPRACNAALRRATGDFVVIFDAEDRPDRRQLREAASRFAAADDRLACLQAPLRIAHARRFLERQFALEYAAQFEVMLPAFARLGLPFPLGGTSNHFRRTALLAVGGWDAFNVTEDADIGFRLAARGYRSGMLRAPTWEEAPPSFARWRPQRSRWVKGYMQTWGGQMRAPLTGGLRKGVALQASLGLAIVSAVAHGPLAVVTLAMSRAVVTLASIATACLQGRWLMQPSDAALLISGWAVAVLSMRAGARRAGIRMRRRDAFLAPGYWVLQSVAVGFALIDLAWRPYHWSKTHHDPARSRPGLIGLALDEAAQGGLLREREAALPT